MNVALFGGTFDPIHLGHIAVARAAQQKFDLDRVYIVPADVPPHKQGQPVTPYYHRYAMVSLATQGQKDLIPSLLEAPDIEGRTRYGASYSIDTVTRFRQTLKKSDRLFFLIGIDAFLDISKWRDPERLLKLCEFIVVSRPGFSLSDIAAALPESMRPTDAVLNPFRHQAAHGDIVVAGAVIHLMDELKEPASATKVRLAASQGRAINRFVDPAVADYIKKTGLYKLKASPREQLPPPPSHRTTRLQVIKGGAASSRARTATPRHPHKEER